MQIHVIDFSALCVHPYRSGLPGQLAAAHEGGRAQRDLALLGRNPKGSCENSGFPGKWKPVSDGTVGFSEAWQGK